VKKVINTLQWFCCLNGLILAVKQRGNFIVRFVLVSAHSRKTEAINEQFHFSSCGSSWMNLTYFQILKQMNIRH